MANYAAVAGFGATIRRVSSIAVDVVIAVYGLALVVIWLTGGVHLGILTLNNAAKPLLILALVVPLRIALGGRPVFLGHPVLRSADLGRLARCRDALPVSVRDAAFTMLVTLAATFIVGLVANMLLLPLRARTTAMPFESIKFAEVFAAWDSGWYFDIASRGYYFNADGQSSIAFFPLYPMLMRAVAWPFGHTEQAIWAAGISISCVAFACALVALHEFTQKIFDDRETARRAILYLAVFPFAVFFTRVYAESLFLLTTVLAIRAAYGGRWWRAGAWGALATLTRPNGILIAIPLILFAISDERARTAFLHRAAALALVPLTLALYCGFVYTLSGDPLGWLSVQSQWGYSLGHPPWEQLLKMVARLVNYGLYDYFFVSPMAPYRLLHGTVALIFLGLTPTIFKRLGVPLGTYVLVSLLIPLSSNALEGVGRYAAVLFPAFMVVATFKSDRLHEGVLIGGALLLALLNCLFVTLHPIY